MLTSPMGLGILPRMDATERQILQRLSPEQRLRAFTLLYQSARSIKAAALRAFHPDWSEDAVQQAVREAFLYGRT